MARRWLPTGFLQLSLALHAIGLVVVLAQPAVWPWVVAVLIGNHLAILGAGLWPRSRLLGPNLRQLPSGPTAASKVGLTFDDGPDPEVTPQVLAILERYDAEASFFCVGCKAKQHPELIMAIAGAGHHVENHSYRHSKAFAFLGPGAMGREVDRAQQLLTELSGSRPVYFRAPAGIRSLVLEPLLGRRGLRLASWTHRGFDTVSGDPVKVLARLTRGLEAGDVILLHDGSSQRGGNGRAVVLDVLPGLLEHLALRGLKPIALDR